MAGGSFWSWAMWLAPPLAGLGLLVVCARDILWSLGWCRIRSGISGGPSEFTAAVERDPEFRRLAADLEELGFAPAGVLWEKAACMRRLHELVLLRRDGKTVARLYRLNGGIPMVGFETVFEGGGTVVTTNNRESVQRSDDYIRESFPTTSARRVLDRHEENTAKLVAAGHVVKRSLSLDDARRHSLIASRHPEQLRDFRTTARGQLKAKLILLLALPALVALWGTVKSAGWGYVLGGSGCMLLFLELAYVVLMWASRGVAGQQVDVLRDDADYRSGTAGVLKGTKEDFENVSDVALEQAQAAQQRAVSRWQGRLADWLVARAGTRPRGFDLRRGWLSAHDRLDVVESFLFPDPPGRVESGTAVGLPITAWEETEKRLRRSLVAAQVVVVAVVGGVLFGGVIVAACAIQVAVAPGPVEVGRVVFTVGLMGALGGGLFAAMGYVIAAAYAKALSMSLGRVIEDGQGLRVECWHPKHEVLGIEASRKCVVPLRRDEAGNVMFHGQATFWHPTGERAGEVEFVDGRAEGPVSVWYANGQLKLQGQWVGGLQEGCWKRYLDTGQEVAAEEYHAGRRIRGTGTMEDQWDEVSRYHWAVPLAFDARRLKRSKVSPSWKKSQRWGIVVVIAIAVLLMGLSAFFAR